MTSTPENKQSLGQFLRQERERKGMTIEQVASATKIGVRTLHALEADQYAELPAKPFVRGFVISYSRFIGLDHKEVLIRFNDYLDEKVERERPNRDAGHSGYAFEKRDGEQQSRTLLAMAMGAFVVVLGVAAVFFKPHHHTHGSAMERLQLAHAKPSAEVPPVAPVALAADPAAADRPPVGRPGGSSSVAPASITSPASNPSPGSVSVAASEEVAEGPSPVPTLPTSPDVSPAGWPPLPEPADPGDPLNSGKTLKAGEIRHRLVVKAGNSVWIRYRVDGKPVNQFPLKKDKVIVLRAKNLLVFQVARPEDVKISYNNEGYHPLTDEKNISMRQGDATLFYPHQLAEKIQEPFPNSEPLRLRSAPLSRSVEPLSTPTP